jgi:hypothetical protein
MENIIGKEALDVEAVVRNYKSIFLKAEHQSKNFFSLLKSWVTQNFITIKTIWNTID